MSLNQLAQDCVQYGPGLVALLIAVRAFVWPLFSSKLIIVRDRDKALRRAKDAEGALEAVQAVNTALTTAVQQLRDEVRSLDSRIAESDRKLSVAIRWIVNAESARIAKRPSPSIPDDLRAMIFEELADDTMQPQEWR